MCLGLNGQKWVTFCLGERMGNLEKAGNRCSLDLSEGREEREKSCSCDYHMVPLEFSAGLHLSLPLVFLKHVDCPTFLQG